VHIRLPRTVRSIRRVQTIARVLTHHGFGHLVAKLNLERYVPIPKRWQRSPRAEISETMGARLLRVFEDLGPTFIKLGQMLSTRPDVIPADIVAELSKLQDQVPPYPTEKARRIIAHDLGAPVEECFTYFAEEPFASGSIAQVYKATIPGEDGKAEQPVVVKVKRPDIEDVVRLDMNILRWIAELADRMIPEISAFNSTTIVEEFEKSILREMDFVNEASTVSRFAEAFGADPNFHPPSVYWNRTGPAVLTLQEIHGISMQTLLRRPDPRIDKKLLARRLMEAFIRQYFEIGMFHADPHPGNLLIEPPAGIGIVDFGQTGRIDETMLGHLVIALTGALNKEPEVIVEVLADMGALSDDTDRHQLRHDFLELIEKYYGLPIYRYDMQTLYFEVNSLVRKNHVDLPREFVLFGKSLVGIGGIALQLDPQLDLVALVKPKLKKLIIEQFSPRRMAKTAGITKVLVHAFLDAPTRPRKVAG